MTKRDRMPRPCAGSAVGNPDAGSRPLRQSENNASEVCLPRARVPEVGGPFGATEVLGHTAGTRKAALAAAREALGASGTASGLLTPGRPASLPEPAPVPLRGAIVVRGQWRDPDDTVAMERGADGRRHQSLVHGYRTADPLDRLPCDAEHRKAARRLRYLHDLAEGVRANAGENERVDEVRSYDPSGAQLDAIEARRQVFQALGQRACAVVVPVVLGGWTVADLVRHHGGNAMAMQGRVMAGLDRLVEHMKTKEPPARATIAVGRQDPFVVDPTVSDLPQERLGRVNQLK